MTGRHHTASTTERAPRATARRVTGFLRRRTAIAAALAVIASGILVPSMMSRASAATKTLVVNSTAWGGPDANPGNGVCATSTGVCTLRAAIEESNALKGGAGDILITVDPSIAAGTKMSGTVNYPPNYMIGAELNGADTNGAYFNVTAPVTIDLDHRLQVDGSANSSYMAAAFYLNGPDIQVLNADQVFSSGTSFIVGPLANRVLIDGDAGGGFGQVATPNSNPQRFVAFRDGASNVTVRNYQVTGFSPNVALGGIFIFNSQSPYTALNNIVIDRVQVLNAPLTNTTCTTSDGSGCRARLVGFWNGLGAGWGVDTFTINGLTFKNMLVRNQTNQTGLQFAAAGDTQGISSASITNLVIEDNVFVNNQGSGTATGNAFITLPYHQHLKGKNSISRNVFTRAATGSAFAIYYYGNNLITANSTTPSGLTIADNHFNGYTGGATIRTERTGLVTVTGNTFGPATGSQAAPGVTEEYTDTASVLYNTYHGGVNYNSNQSIRTWAPSGDAAIANGQLPAGALIMADPRGGALPTATAIVDVTKITATDNTSQAPGQPVTLQAYWTASRGAEIYLGKVSGVTGSAATVAVPLPVGAVALPDGTTATAVDATTGAASGYLRFQTHVEGLGQLESSQYSRLAPLSGTYTPFPTLTIDQAAGMGDPTTGRDLHFTLTSSMPLDPATVTTDAITLAATPTEQTIDAARINPRVVSISEVAGSGGTAFNIVVRVDDSATVAATVAAETVQTPDGLTNEDPASFTDNEITFRNPLLVDPAKFTLVTGEPHGKDFTIGLVAGAPAPTDDLTFAATVSQPQGTPLVSLSTTSPVVPAGQSASAPVTVTAAGGDVDPNTAVTITLTVSSPDTNYDGLVVPTVRPHLFATDPTIHITKHAWVEVADTSSPAGIETTGTPAPNGTPLLDGQLVCFVYTVTNTSADDWATPLTNIVVTDSDTRLGAAGVIGTIGSLAPGASVKLADCTSLAPIDTTVTRAGSGGQS
ncbi:MAG: hypothetical protein FWD74_00080 [Actinomycetia bacterium]|nr:hypothetical protein [Actinomycetes bacterium]